MKSTARPIALRRLEHFASGLVGMKDQRHHLPAWRHLLPHMNEAKSLVVGGQGGEALEDQEWGKGLLMFLYILSGVSILPSFSLLVMSSPEK